MHTYFFPGMFVAGGEFWLGCVQHFVALCVGIAVLSVVQRGGVSLVYSSSIASDSLHKSKSMILKVVKYFSTSSRWIWIWIWISDLFTRSSVDIAFGVGYHLDCPC